MQFKALENMGEKHGGVSIHFELVSYMYTNGSSLKVTAG